MKFLLEPIPKEVLSLVTFADGGSSSLHGTQEVFSLYEQHSGYLTFVKLKPYGKYGPVKDVLRVWAVTLVTGAAMVKAGGKRLFLEPYETVIIQPGPVRVIANRDECKDAEFLVAAFVEKEPPASF